MTGSGERAEVPMLVAFVDLLGFAMQAARVDDAEVADVLDGYYQRCARAVAGAGGRVVKFIGDGALVVFGEDAVDRGVAALLELKPAIDEYLAQRGWDCRLAAKVHFGPVIAGRFGAPDDLRWDVLGKTVNTAAMLDATGVALSVEAFRKLSAETRRHFKKHTWPVTYIRVEDPHRFRRR